MSWAAIKWARCQSLRHSDKFVLVTLAIHANEETIACYPAVQTIADETSLDPRSVHRSLKRLVGSDLIGIQRQTAKGLQIQSFYRLNLWVGVQPPDDTESHRRASPRSDSDASRPDSVSPNQGHRVRQKGVKQKEVSPPVVSIGQSETAGATLIDGKTVAEWYELLWQKYPRKKAKEQARAAFYKAVTVAPLSDIRAGLKRYMANLPEDPQFILGLARWLNEQRWTDDLGAHRRKAGQPVPPPRRSAPPLMWNPDTDTPVDDPMAPASAPELPPGRISQEEAERLGL